MIVAALWPLLLCSACASARLEVSDLSDEEARTLRAHVPTLSLAVVPSRRSEHSMGLAEALADTGLFTSVCHGEVERADVVARIDDPYTCIGAIPIVWILTLGIIPEVHHEDCIGYRFMLSRGGGEWTSIDVPLSQTIVFGWIAIPLNLLPSWGLSSARHRDAAMRRLAIAVLRAGVIDR